MCYSHSFYAGGPGLTHARATTFLLLLRLIGLDINSTSNPPSQYQMFKLVTNRKFVRAAKRVMEELNAAGLKMNSDVRATPLIQLLVDAWAQCLIFLVSLRTRCRRS